MNIISMESLYVATEFYFSLTAYIYVKNKYSITMSMSKKALLSATCFS